MNFGRKSTGEVERTGDEGLRFKEGDCGGDEVIDCEGVNARGNIIGIDERSAGVT
jgi:hypothetical protein